MLPLCVVKDNRYTRAVSVSDNSFGSPYPLKLFTASLLHQNR
nr:MAG TPA: hypothetical protein [Caudoviricetes sp.]